MYSVQCTKMDVGAGVADPCNTELGGERYEYWDYRAGFDRRLFRESI